MLPVNHVSNVESPGRSSTLHPTLHPANLSSLALLNALKLKHRGLKPMSLIPASNLRD